MPHDITTTTTQRCAYDLDVECNAHATHTLTSAIPGFVPVPTCVAHISDLVQFNLDECADVTNPLIHVIAIS